jgi:hypothetical protein
MEPATKSHALPLVTKADKLHNLLYGLQTLKLQPANFSAKSAEEKEKRPATSRCFKVCSPHNTVGIQVADAKILKTFEFQTLLVFSFPMVKSTQVDLQ